MAYRLEPEGFEPVLAALDRRERGGYERHQVVLDFPQDRGRRELGLVYVATPANPNYLGPRALDEIAQQVRTARGPSGPNLDYVLRLAEALREMGAEDAHVFGLEQMLRGASPGAQGA
jgi:cation transport regulator ChaC